MNEISEGYIYCFSNTELEYKKIGETRRTPEERLRQANQDTWTPPEWKIEIAKKVINPKEKEKQLHNLLSKYHERVNSHKKFFRVSPEDVEESSAVVEAPSSLLEHDENSNVMLTKRINQDNKLFISFLFIKC